MNKEVLKYLQKKTGKKQPRRYLLRMFNLACLYFAQVDERDLKEVYSMIDRDVWIDPESLMY